MKKPTPVVSSSVAITLLIALGALAAYYTVRSELSAGMARIEQQIATMQARQERALLMHFHDVRMHLAQLVLKSADEMVDPPADEES